MRRAILAVIETLGRYTVLVIVAAVMGLGYLWLELLDSHPMTFLTLALAAGPLLMAAFALLVGLMFSGTRRDQGQFISRIDAPEIWRIWDCLSPPRPLQSRQLKIDDRMNAAMFERRRIAGLFGRDMTMTLGLPLLAVLDVPAVEAVMAHEIGHHDYKHSHGVTNIGEFETAFVTLFQFMPPDRTIAGGLLYWLLGRAGEGLKTEFQKRSWRAEFEADKVSASKVGADAVARMLTVVEGAASYLRIAILEPLEKTLTGAMRVPPSPLEQVLSRLDDIRSPANLENYAAFAFAETNELSPTHPPFAERLRSIGVEAPPSLGPFGPPAVVSLLSTAKLAELRTVFAQTWDQQISRHLQLE
jgi:Zn-dependent protease with chaperone function